MAASSNPSIWRTADGRRYFLIPDTRPPVAGPLEIVSLDHKTASVSPDWIAPFEITEEQARRVAKDQLGEALTEIRGAIDGKLADLRQRLDEFNRTPASSETSVTPDAASALFDLIKELPRAIGQSLSGDEARVNAAREALTAVQQRLKESGIDVKDNLASFPDRLAGIRRKAADDQTGKTD